MSLLARLDVGRSDRVVIERPGTLRDPANAPVDVIVDNLSATGCLVRLDADLELGATVSLGIPGIGVHSAQISRVEPLLYGCAFDVPISDRQIEIALSAETLVTGPFRSMPAPYPRQEIEHEPQPEDKLPLATRMLIIGGAAGALWVGVLAAVLLAIG